MKLTDIHVSMISDVPEDDKEALKMVLFGSILSFFHKKSVTVFFSFQKYFHFSLLIIKYDTVTQMYSLKRDMLLLTALVKKEDSAAAREALRASRHHNLSSPTKAPLFLLQ